MIPSLEPESSSSTTGASGIAGVLWPICYMLQSVRDFYVDSYLIIVRHVLLILMFILSMNFERNLNKKTVHLLATKDLIQPYHL